MFSLSFFYLVVIIILLNTFVHVISTQLLSSLIVFICTCCEEQIFSLSVSVAFL